MPIQMAGSVRALALVGPTNSGKTTLLEALLLATGAVEKRAGQSLTVGDTSPEARAPAGIASQASTPQTTRPTLYAAG